MHLCLRVLLVLQGINIRTMNYSFVEVRWGREEMGGEGKRWEESGDGKGCGFFFCYQTNGSIITGWGGVGWGGVGWGGGS